jgi:hypothetical protein
MDWIIPIISWKRKKRHPRGMTNWKGKRGNWEGVGEKAPRW